MFVVIDNLQWFFGFKTTSFARGIHRLFILLSPALSAYCARSRQSIDAKGHFAGADLYPANGSSEDRKAGYAGAGINHCQHGMISGRLQSGGIWHGLVMPWFFAAGEKQVDLKNIPADVLLFDLILYGCLPLWLIMGFADWWCHRRSRIEETTGMRESILHAIMGVQIGIPVLLGLYFEINALQFLIMFTILVFHELVAHVDVKYALRTREISILETHVHSFLEVLPFVIVALIICINWPAFVDFVTFNWAGNLSLEWKRQPIATHYITSYFFTLLVIDILPYIEEFIRCWRYQRKAKEGTS